MGRMDRILLAVLAAGVWGLFLQNAGGPTQAEEQRSRRSIERIIEDCTVSGTGWVDGEWLWSFDGQIDC